MYAFVAIAVMGAPSATPKNMPSAEYVLRSATREAARRGTNVMVIFHASWCGWCKRMDAFMARPNYQTLFARNYEIVHLDVLEQPAQKKLENPGAMGFMTKWKGQTAGLPFTVILDKKGNKIIDSFRNGDPKGNIGWAWQPEEVAWFLTMFDQSATKVSEAERWKLEADLHMQRILLEKQTPAPQPTGGRG